MRKIFGLDIGSSSIKLVQMEKSGLTWSLIAAGITSAPPKGMSSDAEADLDEIALSIKKLISQTRPTTKDVIVSLPDAHVSSQLVTLPYLSSNELASAIPWEAEQNLPIPVNEAEVRYQLVHTDKEKNQTQVFLVAAPKVLVNKYIKVTEKAGLNLVGAETELMALTRSITPLDQTVMIVDFGASSTDIGIIWHGHLVFSRSIPTAGEALTRALAANLSLDPSQAEAYKKAYGLSDAQLEGKVKQAIQPIFNVIAEELRKAIAHYQTQMSGEAIHSIVLSGGTAGLPEVVTALAQTLSLEVVIGNPFAKLPQNSQTQALAGYEPLYAIAVGLSKKEL